MQVRTESLRQGAALDEMRRRLEQRRARADGLTVARRRAAEGVDRQKEQMQAQIERVLPLSRALAAAHRQVQLAKSSWDISKFATAALVDMDSEEIQVYVDYFDITLSPRFCLKQHYM
ncbi:hypothetical protein D1007_42137 [Hordeum vulgare]|nr:hypothetical protein D1007_42137 [Hordeum vulgare]